MTEVVQLPRLFRRASASEGILIDQDLDGSEIPSEIAGILVGLGQFRWCDLCVVTCRLRRAMPEPRLQLEQAERFFRVVELRGYRGSGSMAGDAPASIL